MAGRSLGILLDVGCRVRYQIHTRGLENFTQSPSTLVVFNHRRDADTPIIANALFGRRGLYSVDPLPVFVAREDLFQTGFLSDYLRGWPEPLRESLAWLNLRPFLWSLHAHPMRRVAERTLGELLRDMLPEQGELPLGRLLKAGWVERFQHLAPDPERPLLLKEALGERYRPLLRERYGLTKLTRERFRARKPLERAIIEAQLQLFVELLEAGEILQMAPEGAVSRDGHFARIRAGLHVMLNRPRVPVRVLPVGITYDFMGGGRRQVFVNVGPEMTALRGLRAAEASAQVVEAILAQSTITASQLASQLLLGVRATGGGLITRGQLMEYVSSQAERWSKTGLYLDPRLLEHGRLEERLEDYLQYCLASGELASRDRDGFRVQPSSGRPLDGISPSGALSYINNELTSLSWVLRECVAIN